MMTLERQDSIGPPDHRQDPYETLLSRIAASPLGLFPPPPLGFPANATGLAEFLASQERGNRPFRFYAGRRLAGF